MCNLKKAEEYYLRGFKGSFIKERTGISIQSLLKQLLAKGIKYTEEDRIDYQIEYIRERYTDLEIKDAYKNASTQFNDMYKASKGRKIEMLGCAFGRYAPVLKALLGESEYSDLRNNSWKKKQVATMQEKYGVSNAFEKEVFHTFATPEAIAKGREKRKQTLLDRYGVESPNEHPEILDKMMNQLRITNIKRYGVPNPMQNPDIAKKSAKSRQKTMFDKYGAGNSVQIETIRNKIFEARRKNNTLNTSLPEIVLGKMLREHFGKDDVLRNVIVDQRYPYHVDYYIKSLDLFIELNGDRSHNDHWFDSSNPDDIQTLLGWIDSMNRIEKESGSKSRYRRFIRVWTETDVAKRNIAREHNLNYLVFWDGTSKVRGDKRIPNLTDVHDWFNDGCPMPHKWHEENTY